jgi:hypothetical protein
MTPFQRQQYFRAYVAQEESSQVHNSEDLLSEPLTNRAGEACGGVKCVISDPRGAYFLRWEGSLSQL